MATIALRFVSGVAATDRVICGHRVRAEKRLKPARLSFESLENRTVLSASTAFQVACELRDCMPVPRIGNDVPTASANPANETRSAASTRQSCDTIPVCEAKSSYESKQRCETKPTSEVRQQRCESTPVCETKQRCETKSTGDAKQQRCEVKPTYESKQRCETKPTSEVKQQRCESKPVCETKQRCDTKVTTDAKQQRGEAKSTCDTKQQRCETKSTAQTKQQRCETKPACEVKRCSDSTPVRENSAKIANRNCEPEVRESRQCVDGARQVAARAVDGCFADVRFVNEVSRRR